MVLNALALPPHLLPRVVGILTLYGLTSPYIVVGRLRLLSALRLLEEVARHGAADTELILCANEVSP